MSELKDTILEGFAAEKSENLYTAICAPFSRDGHAAATDTFAICCRRLRPVEPDNYACVGAAPNFLGVIESYGIDWSKCLAPLPAVEKCPSCEGKGYTGEWIDCPYCNGNGDCICDHCGDDHICGRCNGSGFQSEGTPCLACDRSGYLVDGTGRRSLEVRGVLVLARRIYAIQQIPAVRVYSGKLNDTEWLAFMGSEYRGLALATKPEPF